MLTPMPLVKTQLRKSPTSICQPVPRSQAAFECLTGTPGQDCRRDLPDAATATHSRGKKCHVVLLQLQVQKGDSLNFQSCVLIHPVPRGGNVNTTLLFRADYLRMKDAGTKLCKRSNYTRWSSYGGVAYDKLSVFAVTDAKIARVRSPRISRKKLALKLLNCHHCHRRGSQVNCISIIVTTST